MRFRIIGQAIADPAWTGAPLTLAYHASATMPQTPNGSMVFGYWNQAIQSNFGKLVLTSGGSPTTTLPVPALLKQPSILVGDWQASNLTVTNISINRATPIRIEAFGPGIPGMNPGPLPINSAQQLATLQAAQGTASPQFMQLGFTSNSGSLAIIAFIGGPPDSTGNNAYVITLNDSDNGTTGPGTGVAPPLGYYATNSGNSYSYEFNWGSSVIYVVNMSPLSGSAVQVVLLPL